MLMLILINAQTHHEPCSCVWQLHHAVSSWPLKCSLCLSLLRLTSVMHFDMTGFCKQKVLLLSTLKTCHRVAFWTRDTRWYTPGHTCQVMSVMEDLKANLSAKLFWEDIKILFSAAWRLTTIHVCICQLKQQFLLHFLANKYQRYIPLTYQQLLLIVFGGKVLPPKGDFSLWMGSWGMWGGVKGWEGRGYGRCGGGSLLWLLTVVGSIFACCGLLLQVSAGGGCSGLGATLLILPYCRL